MNVQERHTHTVILDLSSLVGRALASLFSEKVVGALGGCLDGHASILVDLVSTSTQSLSEAEEKQLRKKSWVDAYISREDGETHSTEPHGRHKKALPAQQRPLRHSRGCPAGDEQGAEQGEG